MAENPTVANLQPVTVSNPGKFFINCFHLPDCAKHCQNAPLFSFKRHSLKSAKS